MTDLESFSLMYILIVCLIDLVDIDILLLDDD